ncbi:hypothetical protein OG530_19300 [Streptomyces decoyicus]|uniref:hypothetical protein n=1 Tax=Streptomyces decoyicus TaxID=249567 RepID=UPI002E19E11D
MADVTMTHPDFPDAAPATATRQQFELLWEERGWQEVEAEPDTPASSGEKRRKSTPPTSAAESAVPSKEH